MFKRLIAAAALAGAFLALSTPANATCQPGSIRWEDGKPVVQLPRCSGGPR